MSDQPAPAEDKEEGLAPEKEAQEQANQAYQEEVPEGNIALFWGTVATFFTSNYLNKRIEVLNAFKKLNDPKLGQELLKFPSPAKFRAMQRDFALAKKEINRQRKKYAERGYAQAGMGPFKKFKEKIDFAAFDRKEQAFNLASAVHTRVNAIDLKLKIDATISTYGLKPEQATKLKRSLAGWQKRNPGGDYRQYLQTYGQYFHLEQQIDPKLQGKKKNRAINKLAKSQKKQLEETSKQLSENFTKAWHQALQQNSGQIILAQDEIKTRLDPDKSPNLLSGEELKQTTRQVLEADRAKVEEVLAKRKSETPQPVTPRVPAIKAPIKPPSAPISIPSFSFPHFSLSSIRISIRLPGLGGLGNLGSRNIGGGLLEKGVGLLATKLGLGAATGGSWTLISEALKPFGIDLDKIAGKVIIGTAKFAVYVVVGVFVYMLIKNSNSTQLVGVEPVPADMAFYQNSRYIAWKNFEEKNLNLLNNSASWVAFEKERLDINYRLVNLPLDADRHDDVKK